LAPGTEPPARGSCASARDLRSSQGVSRMTASLAGRTAVVVGGTSGIGRALAYGLADAGADVVATGRRQELVDEVAAEIEKRGRRSLRVAADVTDRASLEELLQACVSAFGRVHILVNCAGKTKRVSSLEM